MCVCNSTYKQFSSFFCCCSFCGKMNREKKKKCTQKLYFSLHIRRTSRKTEEGRERERYSNWMMMTELVRSSLLKKTRRNCTFRCEIAILTFLFFFLLISDASICHSPVALAKYKKKEEKKILQSLKKKKKIGENSLN